MSITSPTKLQSKTTANSTEPVEPELLYQDVARRIHGIIVSTPWPVGSFLPSERVLAQQLAVSRETLRRSLAELRSQGVLELRGRRGHRVTADASYSNWSGPNNQYESQKKAVSSQPRRIKKIGLTVWGSQSFASNPAMNQTITGFHQVCQERNAMMEMVVVPDQRLLETEWEDLAANNGRDGLVTTVAFPPGSLLRSVKANQPLIYVNQCGLLPEIIEDRASAIHTAMTYLKELGHRRIVYLSGPSSFHSRQAVEQFMLELQPMGIDQARHWVSWTYHTEYDGKVQTEMFLRQHQPTAIIVGDGYLALGALEALKQANLRCPQDVSLVALSDFWTAEQSYGIHLTAANLHHGETGRQAAEMLLDWLEGKFQGYISKTIACDFHIRESTAPVRSGI